MCKHTKDHSNYQNVLLRAAAVKAADAGRKRHYAMAVLRACSTGGGWGQRAGGKGGRAAGRRETAERQGWFVERQFFFLAEIL